jgi:hypothetical protein
MQISKIPLVIGALTFGLLAAGRAADTDTPAQAAARAAVLEKLQALDSAPPVITPAVPARAATPVAPTPAIIPVVTPAPAAPAANGDLPATPPPANTLDAGKDLATPAMTAPPLPIPAGKAEKLEALTAKYKADQINAEQYQTQRAAILAEP